ncbi:MAG: PEP-CTERM sorting domain-containing protein [Akkermansia sp.]|nr:PEP-CTERM sorting domain-containing protein [Akkermansia sp.]
MKKTLVALFALGNAAMGLTLEDAVAVGANTLTLEQATAAITAVAVVDVDKLQEVMAKNAQPTKLTIINFDGSYDIGIQTNYSSYNHDSNGDTPNVINSSGLYGCWNNGGAYGVGMGSGFESADFWAGGVAAAITLTYEYSKGTNATFVLLDAEGNVLQPVGGTANTSLRGQGLSYSSIVFNSDIVTKGYVFNQVVTADDAKALGLAAAAATLAPAPSIPEPTTATLSLLALAGLAARRRRK